MKRIISIINVLFVLIFTPVVTTTLAQTNSVQTTFTVNSTADDGDANPGDGVCDDGSGNCTMRAAMEEANAHFGADTIAFNIPGPGPHTIQPASALPLIFDPLVIDGTTEPDFAGTPIVELDGSNTSNANGIWLSYGAENSVVRGLVINRFVEAGIHLGASGGHVIEGNYIGTDVSGTQALGNNIGVWILYLSSNNIIGGTTPGARNLISGNNWAGVGISESVPTNNVVMGNYIGTDVSGTAALGNWIGVLIWFGASHNIIGGTIAGAGNVISGNSHSGISIEGAATNGNIVQGNLLGTDSSGTIGLGNDYGGIKILDASNNVIGGTIPEARNVLSGNDGYGIAIIGSDASGNLVIGNFIGTDISGMSPLRNNFHGVLIGANASGNIIGGAGVTPGTCDGSCNIIAFNGLPNNQNDGIRISSGTDNAILGNSIFANSDLGIALSSVGITANDPGDPDTGPNNLQNFPELNLVAIDENGDLLIDYSVDSDPTHSAYPLAIQFFKSDTLGQGEIFIGEDTYTTIDFNNGGKTTNLGNAAGLGIAGEDTIVATATDNDGNTSEFSAINIVTGIDITKLEDFIPQTFDLAQNYPNPFNPSTTIRYNLPSARFVTLKVYDILGREVATLVKKRQTAGSYSIRFDASQIPSGLYYYKITAGNFNKTRKMVVMK